MPKVFIVTGASRGLGLAISRALLREHPDARLVAVARGPEALAALADGPEAAGGRVETVAGDLADVATSKRAVDVAIDKFGRLDGVVVNHGVLEPVTRIEDADIEGWRKAFDVNVFSAVSLIRAALPSLRSTKGRIVLVSSGAAAKGYSAWGCYGMTKAALNHLALTLANEERDVTTVSIRPGMVDTQMQVDIRATHHQLMPKEEADKFLDAKKNGVLLPPEQPGNVIARLVAEAPKDLSGAFLSWDDKEKLSRFQDS